jgi:serine/arginine repetitive matrix protein 1
MITGFLEKEAAPFAKSLWKLLLSAQNGAQGVPQELLEAKKAELEQERVSIP